MKADSTDSTISHVMRALRRGAATWLVVTNLPTQAFAGMAAGEDVAALLATQTTVVRALPGFTTQLHGTSQVTRDASAPNVIGILRGSDATLRAEHIVVTAHMDHLGVGRPVNGDSIYNGADDNASGTAAVLEIAQAFARFDARPWRSLIFLTVSGEEEGLWGSGWYVNHVAVSLSQTEADLNLDIVGPGWRDSVSVIGLDFSTLDETFSRVGRAPRHRPLAGADLSELVRPHQLRAPWRSDPVLHGLDAVRLSSRHRHRGQIDAESAARIARLALLTALDMANAASRPEWDAACRRRVADPRGPAIPRCTTQDPGVIRGNGGEMMAVSLTVPRSARALRQQTATLLALMSVLGVSVGQSQNRPDANAYLGQSPPGNTPVVFAPGIISRGNIHSRLEISPDGREMFWNTVDMKTLATRILTVRMVDGKWSGPQSPSFAQEGDTQGAIFLPGGKRLYFSRNTGAGWVAQYVERSANGWSAPRGDGFAPSGSSSFTRSGRVYYSAGMTTKVWNTGIFGARYSADGFLDARAMGAAINVPDAIDYTPYVSPDESFLLFSSNRPLIGDKEAMFIHVTFRKSDGSWSTPQRLSDIPARFPSLSPDGKYLFFCGDDGNFYWVDRTFVDRLKGA